MIFKDSPVLDQELDPIIAGLFYLFDDGHWQKIIFILI